VVDTLPLLVDIGTSETPLVDLSKAPKLKELSFRCGGPTIQQFTMALQTVQSKNLQQITIHPYGTFTNLNEETICQEWWDLDRLLVQFWTSRSIRPEFRYEAGKEGKDFKTFAPSLLPELTRRGLVDWKRVSFGLW
jgi:hypothetical protein